MLKTDGVAVLGHAFEPGMIAHARDRLLRIAENERRNGTAVMEDGASASGRLDPGPNQRVTGLVDKDPVFRDLATSPVLTDMAGRLFAENYGYPDDVVERLELDTVLLSSMSANIAGNGGRPMQLHADQGFVPPSIAIPLVLNVVVPLVDFAESNGATRVAPGSHVTDPTEMFVDPPDTHAVEAEVGSVIFLDGRTVHGTGANQTDSSRPALLINYCPPWVRPFEHRPVATSDGREVRSAADRRLAELRGGRRWFVFGVG